MYSDEAENARVCDGSEVVGVSVDNTLTLDAFKKEQGIDFPLLADFFPHGEVAQKYGVFYPNGVTHRAVIGIDKEGIVRYIDDHAPLEVPELEACAIALGK